MVKGHITGSLDPPGLKMSWQALSFALALALAAGGGISSIRRNDLRGIDRAIAAVSSAQKEDRETAKVARAETIRQLERMEDKLDRIARAR